jgi:endonuclease/exonuclease/phosphatase family metal-dependent hydrolase
MRFKYIFILSVVFSFTIIYSCCCASVSICSWNIRDIGKSKSDETIKFIANTIKQYDVIAIQEVVAGDGGAQAITRLHDDLNRTGSSWDYVVSNPTSSSAYKTERYAYLWNKSKVTLVGKPWLEIKYNIVIDREPYYATFKKDGKEFTIVSFHAITKSRQPETEIKYFKFLPDEYPKLNLIFCGDFNLPESHSVFNPLKGRGYASVLKGQKTSLKDRPINNDYLASEFDNIFYNTKKMKIVEKGVLLFYTKFAVFKDARSVSDHIPVFCRIEIL